MIGAIERHTSIDAPPVTPAVRELVLSTHESIRDQLDGDRAAELAAVGARHPVSVLVGRVRTALLGLPDERA